MSTTSKLIKTLGRKRVELQQKYGSIEKTVDEKFEDGRSKFLEMYFAVQGMLQGLERLRGDQLLGLAEPVAAIGRYYHKNESNANACFEGREQIDEAFNVYMKLHQEVNVKVSQHWDLLSNIKKDIELRDFELLDYDKWLVKTQGKPLDDHKEKKLEAHQNKYEFMNAQVKKEMEDAYNGKIEALVDTYNRLVSSFAILFSSVNAAYDRISLRLGVPVDALGALSSKIASQPPPATKPHSGSVSGASGDATRHPAPAVVGSSEKGGVETQRQVASPKYSIDSTMDEDTKEIMAKRNEQDRVREEQKAIMKRRQDEIEREMQREVCRREQEDRARRDEHDRALAAIQQKINQLQQMFEQENRERDRKCQDFKQRTADKHKRSSSQAATDLDDKEKTEYETICSKRAKEDQERKEALELWRKEEEERMKREHLARLKAQEEKEAGELEQVKKQREKEDEKFRTERASKKQQELKKIDSEVEGLLVAYEKKDDNEKSERQASFDKEKQSLLDSLKELNVQAKAEEEKLRRNRENQDLEMVEQMERVKRERGDILRMEQKEMVRREGEDLERRERKERQRREEDDRRRREELERVRRQQQELEKAEREERDKREREDRERAALRERRGRQVQEAKAAVTSSPPAVQPQPLQPPLKPVPLPQPKAKPVPPPKPVNLEVEQQQSPQQQQKESKENTGGAVEDESKTRKAGEPPVPVRPPKPVVQQAPSPAAAPPSTAPAPAPAAAPPSTAATQDAAKSDGFDPTVINQEQSVMYAALFSKTDSDNDGLISGAEARVFFSKSELSFDVLGIIWKLADMDRDGKLNVREFSVAMHLIYGCLKGHELPASLPASLKQFR